MTKDEREFYPKQGDWLHCRVEVLFNYDTTRPHYGTVIRHDNEEPYVTIFALDDGRIVLDSECQYAPMERHADAVRTQE